jgi:ketosteroid isomerase-like protein
VTGDADRVRALFEAVNRREEELIPDFFDPAFEGVIPPELSAEPDTYRGHEGVRRYFELFYEVMEDVQAEVLEVEEVDDAVVAHLVVHTRARYTGLETGQELFQTWWFRDGRAVAVSAHASREEALAAARR